MNIGHNWMLEQKLFLCNQCKYSTVINENFNKNMKNIHSQGQCNLWKIKITHQNDIENHM